MASTLAIIADTAYSQAVKCALRCTNSKSIIRSRNKREVATTYEGSDFSRKVDAKFK